MNDAAALVRRITLKVARALRDAWLIVGVSVALFLCIELVYRAQSSLRHELAVRAARNAPPPPHNPFENTTWWQDYWVDHVRESHVQWEPYVYLRNPTFSGKIITVDSLGHRITPVTPATSAAPRTLRIFFFGGSTIYGWFQRNDHTIPAEASSRLQAMLGDRARVEATNFGVPGRVFTQEIIELILQLRSGARPDVVVFYDGINDVVATVQNDRPGFPQNEFNRVDDFRRGREIVTTEDPGFANDLKWTSEVLKIVADRVQFVRSIRNHFFHEASETFIPADSAARSIARTYAANTRIVEGLAREYGFQPIYVWQPALLAMRKPLTAREKWIISTDGPRPIVARIRDVHVAIPPLIDDAMRPIAGDRFIDQSDLFRNDSLDVYEDLFGHTYERANPPIVDSMMSALSAAALRALH